jgi:hypothetical protein
MTLSFVKHLKETLVPSPLEDLDELTLRCRDDKARLYIGESVASYRSGAFRSSIVACWIAVCFDVIEKLRELALAGDKEAEKQVQEIESTRRAGDVTRALKFERELLVVAKDKFELISPLEFIDLERLQADRNRCAHPSLTSDDQAYSPSAELARLHIHSAVTHLLQHSPAQGKYALDRLLKDVESEYFPTEGKAARVAFASGPLKRPRESLVRNFVLILCKTLLNESLEYKRRMRIEAALAATVDLHPAVFAATLRERLSALFRAVPDARLSSTIYFLRNVKDTWQHLEPDVVQRTQNYVRNLPSGNFEDLEFLLVYTPLQVQARQRVETATRQEIYDSLFFEMPVEVADRFISIYLTSSSFDEANACAKQIMPHTGDFTADHMRRLLTNVGKKEQVHGSFQLGPLISNLRNREKLPRDEFDQLLKANGLDEFAATT